MYTQIRYDGKIIYPTKVQYEQACRDALTCRCGSCFACKCLEHWKMSQETEYRVHTCSCGFAWEAVVTLSQHTSNISGEETPWCGQCGKRAISSSSTFKRS